MVQKSTINLNRFFRKKVKNSQKSGKMISKTVRISIFLLFLHFDPLNSWTIFYCIGLTCDVHVLIYGMCRTQKDVPYSIKKEDS